MATSYQPIPGRTAQCSVTTSQLTLPFNRFMWDGMADLIDVTAFTSNGFREFMVGLKTSTFVFAGVMGRQWNPFVGPPQLKLGQAVTNVLIQLNSYAGSSANAIVGRWQISGTPGADCPYICSLTSDGEFFDFGGSTA